MYEPIAESLAPELLKLLERVLQEYPDKKLLRDIIVTKVVEELNEEARRGQLPPMPPEWEIKRRFEDYVVSISTSLFRSLRRERVQDLIKSYGRVIVLIGAGFSSDAGIPLARFLNKIDFKEALKDKLKSEEFKKIFKQDMVEREVVKVTKAHEIVAEMFHHKVIIEIICLNWDDLIEKAYQHMYSRKIRKINREEQQPSDDDGDGFYHYLWKFHGDVEDLDYEWIYPGMGGRVFRAFHQYVPELQKHALVFLIIGYSEQEEEIKEEVIRPLESSKYIHTFRIGMDLRLFNQYPKNYIVAPAEWIVPVLFEEARKLML
ncbi:hypothetical protein [Candidatus Methanodesulfokora washburnensis]|uniref:Uncharacterized protein n=1 Tax=Candidatus Methanodesulfokora washburnensis TaxID=2478471 RepID=A0A429GBR8_9CREN|nr:hypothetical protein [Candidatus Methanodesulfokores washburnensis]RSN71245.1 hypothetical protein D6D85_16405 [Candidatus Methanodesulfokores washburnensis]